jgi:hypothetical protein
LGDLGTRALIEVLLLHRRMPADAIIAGITTVLEAGATSLEVAAIEARKAAFCAAQQNPLLDDRELDDLGIDSAIIPVITDETLTRVPLPDNRSAPGRP